MRAQTPREALLEVLDQNDGAALALARAIRQLEGWAMSPEDCLRRIRSCLKGTANRHFELDWYLLAVDVFVDRGIREPLTAMIDERRRDREYARRQGDRAGMAFVRNDKRERRVG